MSRALVSVALVACCCASFWAGLSTRLFFQVTNTENHPMQFSEGMGATQMSGASKKMYSVHRSDGMKDLGGVTQADGIHIRWAGSNQDEDEVRPLAVVEATIERLEAEQKTDLGSDANAKAMAYMMQARSALRGEADNIDGIPVIK